MTETPDFLTVPELAKLLRIKERKVYDLASAGDMPCTRATGKLLFPAEQVRAWIDAKGNGGRLTRPEVFLGSHDPLLEWALRQSRCGLATYFDGSGDGIARFLAGEGVATGLHIHDADSDTWNVPRVKVDCTEANVVLIRWATRRRGLVVRRDTAAGMKSIHDVSGLRVAVRQAQSGAAVLWNGLLGAAGIDPETLAAVGPHHSEQDAVVAVAENTADVALGLEAVAGQFNLSFIPLVEERFDILVDRSAYFEPAIQGLFAFCQTAEFVARAKALKGYDIEGLGTVSWNA